MQPQPPTAVLSTHTRTPTGLFEGKSNLPPVTACKRRNETTTAASLIHGGSAKNPKPVFNGMFDTFIKRCKINSMKEYVLSQKNLTEVVVSTAMKVNLKVFEKSNGNVKRTIATFYSSGVMGKRK